MTGVIEIGTHLEIVDIVGVVFGAMCIRGYIERKYK